MVLTWDESRNAFVEVGARQQRPPAQAQPQQGSLVWDAATGNFLAPQPAAQPAYVATVQQPAIVVRQPMEIVMAPRQRVVKESYCGPQTCCVAVVLLFVFWPAALCVPCCPCDQRERVVQG